MKYTSVEVCAGAGGQALGLEQAGFAHLACVEIDQAACSTLRHNRPHWNVIEGDLRAWEPDASLTGADLLAGGVPCPPFSVAGLQLGRQDERDLFPEMIRLAAALRPRAVMIENVRNLMSQRFASYRDEILREFKELGYESVGWEVLNAADYGVPQLRQRAVLVLMRSDDAIHYRWPNPSGQRTTVGTTVGALMAANGWEGAPAWIEGAAGQGPALVGGSKKHGGPDLGPTRARESWARLGVDGTGLANEAPHPGATGRPRLTVEMAAAVQGFPVTWTFQGRKTAAYRQVGNAFPPPVARAVGQSIMSAFLAADAERSKA